jgi:hypothetical protein
MAAVRELWTDERLDDLNRRVDEGFREMKNEFRALRVETQTEFTAVRAETTAMNRTMLQIVLGLLATTVIGFAATIATILSQT